MRLAGKTVFQALALYFLLATSWSVAAGENDPAPNSPTKLTATTQTSNAESGNVETESTQGAGMLSFLLPGIAWPLFGGVLALAAVNSRKPRVRQTRRTWRGPW